MKSDSDRSGTDASDVEEVDERSVEPDDAERLDGGDSESDGCDATEEPAPHEGSNHSPTCGNQLEQLSIRELKAIIERHGLSHHDCIEKHELIGRARAALAAAPPSATSSAAPDWASSPPQPHAPRARRGLMSRVVGLSGSLLSRAQNKIQSKLAPFDLRIELDDHATGYCSIHYHGTPRTYPVIHGGGQLKGRVILRPTSAKPPSFEQIVLSFSGSIETRDEMKNHRASKAFVQRRIVLHGARGRLTSTIECPFDLVDTADRLLYSSYYGVKASLRYSFSIRLNKLARRKTDVVVKLLETGMADERHLEPRELEVVLPDLLHMHIRLTDAVVETGGWVNGSIEFKEVIRIDIERIELRLVCEEFIHRDPTNLNHRRPSSQRELLSMEVVDGTPSRLTVVPFRIALASHTLPVSIDGHNAAHRMFSLRHFAKFAIIDTEGRVFFRKKEICVRAAVDDDAAAATAAAGIAPVAAAPHKRWCAAAWTERVDDEDRPQTETDDSESVW